MKNLFGRKRIVTNYTEVNQYNVRDFIKKTMPTHMKNAAEMQYLFDYYRGKQPILCRTKEVRSDIIDNTVINHAQEIVSFKVAYLLSEPIVYVGRHGDDGESESLNQLNDWMTSADKTTHDKEIADDFNICGVAMRMVYPSEKGSDVPFEDWVLDPMKSYVAYENTPAKNSRKVAGVTFVENEVDGKTVKTFEVYTDRLHITVTDDKVTHVEVNQIGVIPIVEYVNNEFRMGSFEPVLSIMDAINTLESNRVEATEQNVQALLWFNDIEMDPDTVESLKTNPSAFVFTRSVVGGATPSIKSVAVELQQADQQVLANDLYKSILQITGMPSTGDGNTSDSSNNGSTIVRNGWQHAEERAKDTAVLWKRSDREFLRAVFSICNTKSGFNGIDVSCVDLKFTRRTYEDTMSKATVLTSLLGCDKVAPKVAYAVSNIVPDPEEACKQGMEWYEEQEKKAQEQAELEFNRQQQVAQANRSDSAASDNESN